MAEAPSPFITLMAQVGLTLHAWNQVENSMGLLFNSASDIDDPYKSGAMFDAVVSFDARLAVLDAAINRSAKISAENKELWACLSAKLKKLYKKRNEIAHFSVTPEDMVTGARISPFFSWNKHARNAAKFLTLAQMRERSNRFTEAAIAVRWFMVAAAEDPRLAEARAQLEGREPSLVEAVRILIARRRAEANPPQSAGTKH